MGLKAGFWMDESVMVEANGRGATRGETCERHLQRRRGAGTGGHPGGTFLPFACTAPAPALAVGRKNSTYAKVRMMTVRLCFVRSKPLALWPHNMPHLAKSDGIAIV